MRPMKKIRTSKSQKQESKQALHNSSPSQSSGTHLLNHGVGLPMGQLTIVDTLVESFGTSRRASLIVTFQRALQTGARHGTEQRLVHLVHRHPRVAFQFGVERLRSRLSHRSRHSIGSIRWWWWGGASGKGRTRKRNAAHFTMNGGVVLKKIP